MRINNLVLFSLLIIVLLSSCKKDVDNTPKISMIGTSSTSVTEGRAVTISISYIDGDGDLGENTSNATNLYLTDTRVNVVYKYRIQQLAPAGESIGIKGSLNVVVNGLTITDGSTSQNVSYSVYVVDRAGHQSNSVMTSVINIHQ